MRTTRRRFLLASGSAALATTAGVSRLLQRDSAAHAQAIPGAPSFRGAAGKTIVGPVTLAAGVTVLRAQHNGSSNFGVTLFVPAPGETPQQSYDLSHQSDSFLVFNLIGAVKPSDAEVVGVTADHYLYVDASAAWQISVEQPLPETVTPITGTSFSGKGQDVSPYFMLPPGISSISVSTQSTSLRAWLYHLDDLGGETVGAGLQVYDGRIFDFTFPGNQTSYPLDLPDSGPYLLSVSNTLNNSDAWTMTFA
jgi:hypothetical protein